MSIVFIEKGGKKATFLIWFALMTAKISSTEI